METQNKFYYYHNDINGAPQRLTDEAGNIVWNVHYNIFGKIDKISKNEIDNPIRMQGQYEDEETGLYYNRYRYYDSNISAYVSQDPLGLIAGENLYSYVKNSFGWIDPLGLCSKKSGSSSGKENFENNSRVNPASKLADKAQKLPSSQRPNTIAVIKTKDGKFVIGRNSGGIENPIVKDSLKNIPPNQFEGQCAEVNAISRAFNKGYNLEGAEISVANVRGPLSTSGIHGTSKAPCDVCDELIKSFGIKNIDF